jgi:hypothetical protein
MKKGAAVELIHRIVAGHMRDNGKNLWIQRWVNTMIQHDKHCLGTVSVVTHSTIHSLNLVQYAFLLSVKLLVVEAPVFIHIIHGASGRTQSSKWPVPSFNYYYSHLLTPSDPSPS